MLVNAACTDSICIHLETFYEGKMSVIDGHVSLGEMDTIVQRIAHKNRERDSFDYPQFPTKHAKQAKQREENGLDSEEHGENDSPVVREDSHDQRTKTERYENAID